ncbi:MAG TPA: arylsulfotransferase family protein [Solirubrobacteraceae bacterium]
MEHALPDRSLTRRALLIAGGASVGAVALASAGDRVRASLGALVDPAAAPRLPVYRTRPDLLIPAPTVTTLKPGVSPGLMFLAPYNAPNHAQAGAMIVGGTGEPIWEQPLPHLVTTDFRVQSFKGAPALTWWQGIVELGHGVGHYVIADSSYRPLATVNAGNRRAGDLHEFLLTNRGTALLTTYLVTNRDLRAVHGLKDGTIQDAMFQEIDVASGRVLLEWHSLDHIPITESYWPLSKDWDYVHLNSIEVDRDENLLVSSRNTHTIYKLARKSGEIIWRLGGKQSNFQLASDAVFVWQHDARRQSDGSITVFDNGDALSRALVLNVDESARKVILRSAFVHPSKLHASSQGNVQVLPGGNVHVGWGAQPYVSEFSPSGELLLDAKLGTDYVSYRSYRIPWSGTGAAEPTVAIERSRRRLDAFVSWNGDTRVARWQALTGTTPQTLSVVGSVARTGFETGMRLSPLLTRLAIRGVDAAGTTVGTSKLLAV